MRKRLLTAAILIPVVLYCLLMGPPLSVILGSLVYIAIQYEFSRFAFRIRLIYQNMYFLLSLLPLPVLLIGGFTYFCFSLVILMLVLFAGVICLIEREVDPISFEQLLLGIGIGTAYICLLGGIIPYALLTMPPQLTIWTIVVISISDSAAFFGGAYFKGRKLAPRISPKKTVSGMFSGLIVSLLVGVALGKWFFPDISILFLAFSTVIIAIAGIFGDLTESLIKRSFGVKDSGELLPGHGGVLDRVDALLFAVPCALLLARVYGIFWS